MRLTPGPQHLWELSTNRRLWGFRLKLGPLAERVKTGSLLSASPLEDEKRKQFEKGFPCLVCLYRKGSNTGQSLSHGFHLSKAHTK